MLPTFADGGVTVGRRVRSLGEMSGRRWLLVGAGGPAAAVIAIAILMSATAQAGSDQPVHSARANRRAAVTDATGLLTRLTLPAGAAPLTAEPAGDHGTLARPAITLGPKDLVDRHAWWRVPGSPASVEAFIRRHLPHGATWAGGGSSSGGGAPSLQFATLGWRPIRQVAGDRDLVVGLVALPGGSTGVRVDAEVQWLVPRPAGERIPSGARVLGVTVAAPGAAPLLTRTVTARRRVNAVAAAIDRLPIVQPYGPLPCPMMPAREPEVTFTFRATTTGPVLARASEPDDPSADGGPCFGMALSIRGRSEPALDDGGTVILTAQRLLGVTLERSP